MKQRWDYLPQVCLVRGDGDNQDLHTLFTSQKTSQTTPQITKEFKEPQNGGTQEMKM